MLDDTLDEEEMNFWSENIDSWLGPANVRNRTDEVCAVS